MEGTKTKLVSVDIMRGEHFYASFRKHCRVIRDFVTGVETYDKYELLDALYAKYPSIRGNKKFNIIIY